MSLHVDSLNLGFLFPFFLGPRPNGLLGGALGERKQRKEVNTPCKDKQLSGFKELGSRVARNIAVLHCSHHSVK